MKLPVRIPLELNARISADMYGCVCEYCQHSISSHYKYFTEYFESRKFCIRKPLKMLEEEYQIDWKPIEDLKEGHGVLLCERSLCYGGYIFGVRQDNQIKVEFDGEKYQLPISLFSHYSEIQMPDQ